MRAITKSLLDFPLELQLDNQRARQIVKSLGVIEVLYNGSPVWIEDINGYTAEVSYINTKNKVEVQVENLIERKQTS
jgi:H-type small acid-soluble spore protein